MTTFSVIASILSENELVQFLQERYNLDHKLSCKLYRTGINHTYFVYDEQDQYVLRIYSKNWRTKLEIEEELKLIQLLQSNELSVSFPIPDKHGNHIQELKAPEGLRYAVLFTYAKGEKVRFLSHENCFETGSLMAKFHKHTIGKKINRVDYSVDVLLKKSYENLIPFFDENLNEMRSLKEIGEKLSTRFEVYEGQHMAKGVVHLDIWYDNFNINEKGEITLFDFDNLGSGWLVLDVGYFCKQLFFIESDKKQYESKVQSFLNGYNETRKLNSIDLKMIPEAGASIFIFYLGVQAKRFDWSNLFLTKNYLNMMLERIQAWLEYSEARAE